MRHLKRMPAWQVLVLAALISLIVFALTVLATYLLWLYGTGEHVIEWDLWSMLEGLSAVAAFAVVVGGGFFALLQLIEATERRHMEIYNDVFKRLMDDREIAARRWIYQKLPDDPEQGIASLSEVGQRHVKLVLNSFDHLGFLLMQDWVTDDGIIGWVSPIVLKTWAKLGPYVAYEAARRGEPYYYGAAVALARRCEEWWRQHRPDLGFVWLDDAL